MQGLGGLTVVPLSGRFYNLGVDLKSLVPSRLFSEGLSSRGLSMVEEARASVLRPSFDREDRGDLGTLRMDREGRCVIVNSLLAQFYPTRSPGGRARWTGK